MHGIFLSSVVPDKHTATIGMRNERLELRRMCTEGRHYGDLTYAWETLRNEAPHRQITIETVQLSTRGQGVKRKGKHTLCKSNVLLTAVKFATINSVVALILSLELNQNCHLTKAGNTMECRRLAHTDIAATHVLAVYEVVSCQQSRLTIKGKPPGREELK